MDTFELDFIDLISSKVKVGYIIQIFFLLTNKKKWNNNTKLFSTTKKTRMKKVSRVICGRYRKFKNPKTSYIFFFLLFAVNERMEMKKYLKKNKQLRY